MTGVCGSEERKISPAWRCLLEEFFRGGVFDRKATVIGPRQHHRLISPVLVGLVGENIFACTAPNHLFCYVILVWAS